MIFFVYCNNLGTSITFSAESTVVVPSAQNDTMDLSDPCFQLLDVEVPSPDMMHPVSVEDAENMPGLLIDGLPQQLQP